MAFLTHNTAAHRSGNPFVAALTAIGNWLIALAETNQRSRRIQALSAMSDAELAKLGIERKDIARHVFRDHYYV